MFLLKRKIIAFLLSTLIVFSAIIFSQQITLPAVKAQATEAKNVILIGWDGVQRNHLFELLNRSLLPNLASFINQGTMVNITVSDHATDTKAGWTQILTGYKWWKTGVYSNVYWFHSIPAGYTIQERAENYFGSSQIATGFIIGKLAHMEIADGTGDAATGRYTHQALYRNLPPAIDVCTNGNKNDSIVGPATLQFLDKYANNQFFTFFHFSDPDSAGHNPQGGENSDKYEQAIVRCDFWLGQILNKINALNITQKTMVYVTADHGFDEGGNAHNYAPYVTLATNDKNVIRNGEEVDVAPTVYYALGMWGNNFNPALDGYPLQLSLPDGVEQERQNVLSNIVAVPKTTIASPADGASVTGTVNIMFNSSSRYLSAALLLIDNTLTADGPWTWQNNEVVRVNGSYSWDFNSISYGSHTITVLAFDKHGAYIGPSTSTITVSRAAPALPSTTSPTTPVPQRTPAPHLVPTPESSNQTTPLPSTSPSNSPMASPQISQTFPAEYIYLAVVVFAVATVVVIMTGYLLKHKK